jgi:hypothetical protein
MILNINYDNKLLDQLSGGVQKADQTAAAPADVAVWAGHSLPGGQLAVPVPVQPPTRRRSGRVDVHPLGGERQIVLWGWGIWLGQADTGAIFVNRYRAKPQFTAVAALTKPFTGKRRCPAWRTA